MILNLFLLSILTVFLFWMATFVYTSFRGSPYVPIKTHRYSQITKLIKKGDRVADLGCGDGRILVEAIKRGAKEAHGWELDFGVFLLAFFKTHRAGINTRKIKLHFDDYWNADLSSFNVIYTYQMTKYMGPFKQKLLPQLQPGTLIISPDYKIPGLKVHQKISDADRGIYIYKI